MAKRFPLVQSVPPDGELPKLFLSRPLVPDSMPRPGSGASAWRLGRRYHGQHERLLRPRLLGTLNNETAI